MQNASEAIECLLIVEHFMCLLVKQTDVSFFCVSHNLYIKFVLYNTKIKDIFHIHKNIGTILIVECCNRLYHLLNENFQFMFRVNRRKLNFMLKNGVLISSTLSLSVVFDF